VPNTRETSRFERSVRVTGGDGRYTAQVDPVWNGPVAPNGGVLAATMLRAAEAELGEPRPPVRTISAHFLDAPAAGEVEISIELLRRGHRVGFAEARMHQGGKLTCTATVGFSAARPGELPLRASRPDLPSHHGRVLDPQAIARFPPVFAQLEMEPTEGPEIFSGAGEAHTGGWMAIRDDPGPLDAARLCALCDLWWPAVFSATDGPLAVPTLQLTVYLRRTEPVPAGPVYARFTTREVIEGQLEEIGELYSRDGELLAESRQLALLIPLKR
jgi:acyl-CoA thioesterase